MSKFVFAVVSLVLFSSSPTFASDGFWSQLKDLGHRCAVQPYAISAEGFKVYGSLRSVCAELELTAKQAAFVLEGSHYVATLEDSEHADDGDLNHLRIYARETGELVASAENVAAFGEVAIALVGGDDRFRQELDPSVLSR